jgi:Ca2+-binding EF-hand superfamily protein
MWRYLIIASGVAMATAALAQDTAAVFAALDSDDNGSISEMEAERNAFVMEAFSSADSDTDGALSQEEFDAAFG